MKKTLATTIGTGLLVLLASLTSWAGDDTDNVISEANKDSAIELGKWGMPVVSFFAQKEANIRDMGAQPNQVLYWSQPFDHNNKVLTPNDVVLYISAYIETFDGPMVLEVPSSEGEISIFGSIIDPFMVPLDDVGGEKGIDKGLGGKILITPPGFDGEIPDGYLHIPSAHYNTVAGLRVTPPSFEQEDLDRTEAYIKQIGLYRYGSNDKTVFVDGENKPYDPKPPYDENFFRLIDLYIQTEKHKVIDAEFISQMDILGIEKGKEFVGDDSHREVAEEIKAQLQAGFRSVGNQFFPNSSWTTPVDPIEAQTQFTYVDADGNYYWEMRAQTWHWAIWGPKHLGGDTYYLIGQKDKNGDVLSSQGSYRLTVPANVPAEKFWSVNVYEFETGGTFFDDVDTVAVNSLQPDLVTNDDGSVTLTFGPEVPEGMPISNHVPTVGDGSWFTLFRWYGPMPELFSNAEDKWTLGDFEKYSANSQDYGVEGIELVNGVPTTKSSRQLFDTMDYYGGVLTYLWAMPAMGLKGWENAGVDMGADPSLDGQISLYQGYDGAAGIVTPNASVTYVISFVDTNVHGPAVWIIPPGPTAGYVGDQWQRPVRDTGVTGPDKGQGIKLLIVGPGQEVPEHDGSYTVVESHTNVVWLGTRNMAPPGDEHDSIIQAFDSYPFFKPELAGRIKLRKDGPAYMQYQPHGMRFWENLNEIVQREVIAERDVFFHAMLKNLGIEKGKAFNPSEEQKSLLIEAERVGYLMAVNNSFRKRFEGAQYYPGKRWYVVLINDPSQRQTSHGELFERAAWFHEAIGSTNAMKLSGPGPGSTYLGQYVDDQGAGFDGAKTYRLVVPADVPAKQFWALTVYNSESRTMIRNNQRSAEIISMGEIKKNDDGTVTLFVGPSAPKGYENNWIETAAGQNWFSYFRFYNPTEPYFDKSWQLDDFEQVR